MTWIELNNALAYIHKYKSIGFIKNHSIKKYIYLPVYPIPSKTPSITNLTTRTANCTASFRATVWAICGVELTILFSPMSIFISNSWNCRQENFLLSVTKSGVDIFGFLLLSGFGPDPKLLLDYVQRNLLRRVLHSSQLEYLVGQMNASSRATTRSASTTTTNAGSSSWGQRRAFEEQVCFLLF